MAKKKTRTARQPLKTRSTERGGRAREEVDHTTSLARPDQQAGGPEHHGLDAEEDRNP